MAQSESALENYLRNLPRGLDSAPECAFKASFLLAKLKGAPASFSPSSLPPQLRDLVTNPPPASMYIPATHLVAVNAALVDAFEDENSYREYTRVSNRRLFSSPLYRALFLFISPEVLVKQAKPRWNKIQTGIELESEMTGERSFRATLHFPPHLVPRFFATSWGDTLEVTFALTRSKEPKVSVTTFDADHVVFDGEWK